MQKRARIPHVPALDGIRGAAVIAVLLFHAGHLSGGFLGVDLFFTLSGYLITSLLVAEWQSTGRIALGQFWVRRARRLLPAVLVVVAAVAVYAWGWAAPTDLGTIRDDGLATLFYVANWHSIVAGRGYWDSFSAPSPFEHTWSLAIEEQFYVIWPLLVTGLLVFGRRRGRDAVRLLLVITVLLAAASAVAMVVLYVPGHDPSRVYLGSDTRAGSILIGAALALVMARRPPIRSAAGRFALEGAAIVSLGGLLVAWARIDGLRSDALFQGGMTACALAAAVVIAAVSHPRQGIVARALANRVLRGAGLISYGLYLWHWPVFVIVTHSRTDLDGWTLVGARLGISLAVALASYWLVEQPIRHGKLRGLVARISVPAGMALSAGSLLLGTIGAVAAPSLDLTAGPPPTATVPPGVTVPPTTSTIPAPPGAVRPPRVLLAGDSVGWTIAQYGLAPLAAGAGFTLDNQARFGCGLARGDGQVRIRDSVATEDATCPTWNVRWAAEVQSFHPTDTVLALGAWDLADHKRAGQWVHPCQAGFDTQYRTEVAEAISSLSGPGIAVHVLTYSKLTSAGAEKLGLSTTEAADRVACANTSITAAVVAAAGTALVDIGAWTCPGGSCPDKRDGVTLRDDGVHYNGDGGKLAGKWLIDQLTLAPPRPEAPPTTSRNPSSTPVAASQNLPTLLDEPLGVYRPTVTGNPSTPLSALRQPTASAPLRVMTVGDSYMFDVEPAVGAILSATGRATVSYDGIMGMGLNNKYPWRQEWARLLADTRPEVIVTLWGAWDVKLYDSMDHALYRNLLDEAVTELTSTGARLVIMGLPPSKERHGDTIVDIPRDINVELQAVAAAHPGTITYLDTMPVIAPAGVPVYLIDGVRVRKDDLGHFCPEGSRRFARAVLTELQRTYSLGKPAGTWSTADWTRLPRYDDPPGTCAAVPPASPPLG